MRAIAILAAAAGVGVASSSALADISDPALHILATSALGSGEFLIHVNQGTYLPDGSWRWETYTPFDITDPSSGRTIATFDHFECLYHADPIVTLNFGATAGTSTTTFTISSALLSFPALTNPTGTASAGVTLTDQDGNGATFNGLQPGNFAYRANYNGQVPAGTTFATLIPTPISTGSFGTQTGSGAVPPTLIPGSVGSISAQWSFNLTANDAAAGTSVFSIVPAPGTGALLGLGLLAARRRRR